MLIDTNQCISVIGALVLLMLQLFALVYFNTVDLAQH